MTIDAAAWTPGGRVTVTISCSPSRAGFTALDPPARTFAATATALIDPHRAPGLP